MLKIVVGQTEAFDEATQEFVLVGGTPLELEHSLVSLSKWESKFQNPFLGDTKKTTEETVGYVEAMCLTSNVAPEVFLNLTEDNIIKINAYIDNKMTATWFSEINGPSRSREVITSELIYYWLITFQIPFECETWHLNRLFTLIKVCNMKQAKPKKMSRAEMAQRNRSLNEQRKQQLKSSG